MLAKEGYITTDDEVRLYFQTAGSGANAVLIPNGFYFFDEFASLAVSHTLIFFDLRNRGRSDTVSDQMKLSRGIQQDVDDIETVRKYFQLNQVVLIGHSYVGLIVALYTLKYPAHVNRLVQIGATQPDASKEYPAHLSNNDGVLAEVFGKIGAMQKEKRPGDPVEACKQFWSVLRAIYVANPANIEKINWGRCELPNERNFMKYWTESIFPSLQNVHLTAEQFSDVSVSVLIIHGTSDRSVPYGSARDWSLLWPNARLLTLENVAHAPWIESPEIVFNALHQFLNGRWPPALKHEV